jgi:hypothetical protein
MYLSLGLVALLAVAILAFAKARVDLAKAWIDRDTERLKMARENKALRAPSPSDGVTEDVARALDYAPALRQDRR